MFYKGDSVYLYIVDFGSEFNGFGFLASDNGAKVMPVDTHDTVGHFFACKSILPLLKDCLYDRETSLVIRG